MSDQPSKLEINGATYVKQEADFQQQTDSVCNLLSNEFFVALSNANAIIAGGAVLSAFTHQPTNDVDVYFRSKEEMTKAFLELTKSWEGIYLGHTDKSITLKDKDSDIIVQFIYFDYFDNAQAVFDAFDFTVCMAAIELTPKSIELVTDQRFFSDVASRTLHFNSGTRFPYISLIRVNKYRERGYKIGKGNLLAIAMACAGYPISSWEEAKTQLGGVYGNQLELDVEHYGEWDEEQFTTSRLLELVTDIKERNFIHSDYPEIYRELTGNEYH